MASTRREKKFRQTYPGPNSADNQQMLQDIKDTLDHHQQAQVVTAAASTTAAGSSERDRSLIAAAAASSGSGSGGSSASERDMRTDYPTTSGSARDTTNRRSSPPSDREQVVLSGSPGATQRVQQNRSTPTKQLGSSDWNKQTMKEIKKQLRPFASSDPGFHPPRDRVNKKMVVQLINYGYSEVSY